MSDKRKFLDRTTACSALGLSLIYVFAFLYFGLIWAYPGDGSHASRIAYLVSRRAEIEAVYFVMYLLFGVVLSIVVLGLYEKTSPNTYFISRLAAVFGFAWFVLVMASGMVFIIGLRTVAEISEQDIEKAYDVWLIVHLITEGLGGGNEIVGGVWVMLVSVSGLRGDVLSKPINHLGVFVGVAGLATIYPHELATEVFGITQLIWFFWLSIHLLKNSSSAT